MKEWKKKKKERIMNENRKKRWKKKRKESSYKRKYKLKEEKMEN